MTSQTSRSGHYVLGLATIAFAIAFNIPFAILASTFDYPAVLRRPAGEILTLFQAGGTSLILTWYAFGLAALLFVPVAITLSLRGDRVARHPSLTVGAAIAGSLAGLAQAIGLLRWVFVVPGLAAIDAGPGMSGMTRASAEGTFALINLYGGVAIGEHIGQLLTALFVLMLSLLQYHERNRVTASIGYLATAAIVLGTGEGLAMALGHSGALFSLATIAGFLLLTLWLVATGITILRAPRP